MNNALVATLGGVWALLFWGTADWLIAKSSRKHNQFFVNLAVQIPGFLILAAIVLLTNQHLPNLHDFMIIAFTGFAFSVAFLTFIRAFSLGAIGLVAPVSCVYPLFTLIFTALLSSLTFKHSQILASVIIVAGVVMTAYEKRDKKLSLHVQHQATVLALISALLWGLGNYLQNTVVNKMSWQMIFGIINFEMVLFALIIFLIFGRKKVSPKELSLTKNKQMLIAGTIYTLGSIGFYFSSVKVGSFLIPVIVSSAQPLYTSFLGAVLAKEKLTIIKRLGAVIIVAGIILINL